MSVHIGIDELADAAGGVLDPERTQQVESHVRECLQCRDTWTALSEVGDLLAAEPAPAMPPEVARRLDAVLAQESAHRAATQTAAHRRPTDGGGPGGGVGFGGGAAFGGGAGSGAHSYVRHTLGTFGADLPRRSRTRFLAATLAACAAAAVVGFAGYVLSASAGLNEPSATAPAVVSSSQLGTQAHTLQEQSDLTPHRFSEAWECAREVTSGRITAITSAVVDGQPALLVYTRSDGESRVTVVTGCTVGRPSAAASTTLPG